MEMEPLYTPHGVEERWQRTWEAEGLYNAEPDPSREPFVDAHPPPNVTGELHLGHALQLALGDTIIRLKRMQGYNVLFQPGYDHAGISTQNAVEKALLAEGTSRQELGRAAFEARVWDWLREYGGKIMIQFRRMGASLDYRRERCQSRGCAPTCSRIVSSSVNELSTCSRASARAPASLPAASACLIARCCSAFLR